MLRAPPSRESAGVRIPESLRTPPPTAQIRACACGQSRARRTEARKSRPRLESQSQGTNAERSVRPCCSCALLPLAPGLGLDLLQPVTCAGIQIKFVELFQFADLLNGRRAEWRFAVKGVQYDALKHIAQRHVVIFGK